MDVEACCKYCESEDTDQLVACTNKKCASSEDIYCKCCCECRKPYPCGTRDPDHFSGWQRHLPSKKSSSYCTHVQRPITDPRVAEIFHRETEISEQAKLHESDRTARWFIVRRPPAVSNSRGTLTWTDRFDELTANTRDPEDPAYKQPPRLVSFIGKTGVGKSTIIRALTLLSKSARDANVRQKLKTPVTRINNQERFTQPTSAGVNLYKYPDAVGGQGPILFADCEGFGAGAAEAGANTVATDDQLLHRVEITSASYSSTTATEGSSQSSNISNLYARFLYAFGDVVCFVSSNSQSFNDDVEELLLFVTKGSEVTLNQTPGKTLIFIFNKIDDHNVGHMDPKELKKDALRKLGDVWDNSACLATIRKEKWANEISSTEGFLKHYFTKIKFCYIPRKGNASLTEIAGQYTLLQRQITDGARLAFDRRTGTLADYNTQETSNLSRLAFRHFATKTTPFNFATALRRYDESTGSMEDHIKYLLGRIESKNSPKLNLDFSKIVALAFLNHCLPYGEDTVMAPPETWWSQVYERKCSGIVKFYEEYPHCQFKSEAGNSCMLLSDFHLNTHQGHKGKKIGKGTYKRIDHLGAIKVKKQAVKKQFLEQYGQICQLDSDKKTIGNPRPSAAQVLEYRKVTLAYLAGNWKEVYSYKTCFTCLRSLPDHVLPCGHALCETCAIDFGSPSENTYETEILLDRCVICREPWKPAQSVQVKPVLSGVRVLSLDGGGVRGILELEFLKIVEEKIDLDLPIHRFFDLITGVSTGSIIALGLVINNLKSKDMAKEFKKIIENAFRVYQGFFYWTAAITSGCIRGIPLPVTGAYAVATGAVTAGIAFTTVASLAVIGTAIYLAKKSSLYSNKPLESVLGDLFAPGTSIFGSSRSTKTQRSTRVAVMAARFGTDQVTTIANYNRQLVSGSWKDLERGDSEEDELKAWEAGLCASAIPPYFQAFTHDKTMTIYSDKNHAHIDHYGWVRAEYQKIWASPNDKNDTLLDVLVSVGVGKCSDPQNSASKELPPEALPGLLWDPEKYEDSWERFKKSDNYNSRAHHRLNVLLNDICPIDQVRQMPSLCNHLRDSVDSEVEDQEYIGTRLRGKIEQVARLLVAKLFFFEPTEVVLKPPNGKGPFFPEIKGKILCRLRKDERALNKLIERVGYFIVKENGPDGRVVTLSDEARRAVQEGRGFQIDLTLQKVQQGLPVEIFVLMKPADEHTIPTLISGFPRRFDELRDIYALKNTRYRHA